jgi:sulfane dehydrogenase subunit SoxC
LGKRIARNSTMMDVGLKRMQVEALWELAQSVLITQAEFFEILNRGGPAELLDLCSQKGAFVPTKPFRAEMKFELMRSQRYQTPNSLFYTFSNSSPPSVDIKNWRLHVEGDGIERPFSLNYRELLRLPYTTVTRYLDCAGNGRLFFDTLMHRRALGPQWHFGGYGLADWTGVRLADLLERGGLKKEAVEVIPVGLDSPAGQRPMPVAKALEDDTLLAYIMNGKILPAEHGFPVRAFLSGWVGVASVKWLGKIVVTTKRTQTVTNTSSYVFIGPDYKAQPPAKGPILTSQTVKSACCLPWPATLKPGPQVVLGYAWSPFGKIRKVEVSLDEGKTFQLADLEGPNIEKAGCRWTFGFDAGPDLLSMTPRATDEKGNTQYDLGQQKWNQLGYLFGAIVPHPVRVSSEKGALEAYHEHVHSPDVHSGCC